MKIKIKNNIISNVIIFENIFFYFYKKKMFNNYIFK